MLISHPIMRLRLFLFFLISFSAACGGPVREIAPISYTLRFPEALNHYMEVEADIPTLGADQLELFMPVWTPGSYLVREYARNIDRIDATTTKGDSLEITKTTKNRWVVNSEGLDRVRVTYRLYGWEINVRSNWIEGNFAMINGAPTYLSVVDNYQQRPYQVHVELPEDWAGSYTALQTTDRPNSYFAPDFDTLIDSPLLAGSPQVDSVDINGVPLYLVTLGGAGVWDNERALRNVAAVAKTQQEFWGQYPSDKPYYIFNLLTGFRGGLEHKDGFVMTADRWYSSTRGGIGSWLSLVSHEYFHLWNGKRLRPVQLGPFDYEHEAFTRSLWVVEGITSYYQHILLRRAGFSTRESYLRTASNLIRSVENTPGRLVQSMSDSSFDSWIKSYRPDENSSNTRISYYGGGSVVGILLDAEVRRVSNDTKSLDDVMRLAYDRYSGERGYTEAEFIALTSEVAGSDMAPWFRRVVQTPSQHDYQPFLDWYGLEFEAVTKPEPTMLPNGIEPPDAPGGWLGADLKVSGGKTTVTRVLNGTPAYAAGLYVKDELIAVNGFRIEKAIASHLRPFPPGTTVELLISRRGELITIPATLAEKPNASWTLKIRKDATPEQTAHLESWLGTDEIEAMTDES